VEGTYRTANTYIPTPTTEVDRVAAPDIVDVLGCEGQAEQALVLLLRVTREVLIHGTKGNNILSGRRPPRPVRSTFNFWL
jgi:hypothetical protein